MFRQLIYVDVGDETKSQFEVRPEMADKLLHFILHPVSDKHILDVIAERVG